MPATCFHCCCDNGKKMSKKMIMIILSFRKRMFQIMLMQHKCWSFQRESKSLWSKGDCCIKTVRGYHQTTERNNQLYLWDVCFFITTKMQLLMTVPMITVLRPWQWAPKRISIKGTLAIFDPNWNIWATSGFWTCAQMQNWHHMALLILLYWLLFFVCVGRIATKMSPLYFSSQGRL